MAATRDADKPERNQATRSQFTKSRSSNSKKVLNFFRHSISHLTHVSRKLPKNAVDFSEIPHAENKGRNLREGEALTLGCSEQIRMNCKLCVLIDGFKAESSLAIIEDLVRMSQNTPARVSAPMN